jgi:O-acetyl-ADP-ribose deacetylase (regulator of RNase III)
MIKYIDGDLVKMAKNGDFDVIFHCCNCFCVMGSGIAPQIKNAFPEAYVVDCKTTSGDKDKLGTISYTENTKPIVVNLYGQFGYGNRKLGKPDVDYTALRLAIREMKNKFSGKVFGGPKLGAGLAGGDWSVIEKILEEEMRGEFVTIVNYVP